MPPMRSSCASSPSSPSTTGLGAPPSRTLCCRSLLAAILSTCSSTVLALASLITRTGRSCPMRCARSMACLSAAGLKSTSWMMTVSAAVRLMPSPPARVVSRKTPMVASALKASIRRCRSGAGAAQRGVAAAVEVEGEVGAAAQLVTNHLERGLLSELLLALEHVGDLLDVTVAAAHEQRVLRHLAQLGEGSTHPLLLLSGAQADAALRRLPPVAAAGGTEGGTKPLVALAALCLPGPLPLERLRRDVGDGVGVELLLLRCHGDEHVLLALGQQAVQHHLLEPAQHEGRHQLLDAARPRSRHVLPLPRPLQRGEELHEGILHTFLAVLTCARGEGGRHQESEQRQQLPRRVLDGRASEEQAVGGADGGEVLVASALAVLDLLRLVEDKSTTWKVPPRMSPRISARSASLPWYLSTLRAGHHISNSRCQLVRVEVGATTRCGPLSPSLSSCARRAMACTVLPRPISSARMPLAFCMCRPCSQLSPTSWCGAIVIWVSMIAGCAMPTW
eukprot:scaffold37385_cov44-Phaeocystis_antarctica.AAC.4